MSAKTNYKITALCLCLLCLLAGNVLYAQNVHSQLERNLKIQFLKDSLEVEEGSFLFNTITLLYTGTEPINLEVTQKAPSFINVVSASTTSIQLQPNQQQIIPVRFNLNKSTTSSEWYAFTINILVKQTGRTIERRFRVRQKAFNKWRCTLRQPSLVFRAEDDRKEFWINVENTGTTTDEYKLEFDSELQIDVPFKDRHFVLLAGQSKIIKAEARLNLQQARRVKNLSVNIYISNEAGEKKALYQKFIHIGQTYTEDVYKWRKMPLAVELGVQSSFDRQFYYTAALNGTYNIDKERSISVNFRTNDLYNQFKTNSSIATAEYATKNWSITGGTIVDFNHFMINGNGLKLKHLTKNQGYIEFAGINSNLYHTNQFDFNLHQAINEKISITNNSFINLDAAKNTNSYLTINKLHWDINQKNRLTIEAGAGTQNIKQVKIDTTLSGPMFGYRFESGSDKLSFISSVNYYSKNFPGFNKGFNYHNHELRYKINKTFISGFYEADRKIFALPEDSILIELFNTNNKEFGVRSGFHFGKVSASLSAGLWQQQQDSAQSPISRTLKVSSSINWMLSQNVSFSLFSNAGYVYLKERPDISPVFAFNNFGSIQAKSVGLHFRYDTGPFYYYEIKQYAQQQGIIKRLQIAPFYDYHFKKLNSSVRLQMNYAKEEPRDYDYLLVSSQFLYSPPKLNMDMGLMTRVDVKNNASPFVNFTIRKRLQLPVQKNMHSYNFQVALFKDKNDNNKFDSTDEYLPNTNVLINDQLVVADVFGAIDFKNVSEQPIKLDFSNVINARGWIPSQGLTQTINPTVITIGKKKKDKKRILIPFKESKMITGKLVLIADDKSSQTMQLNSIRITATDNKGHVYHTLTDLNGEFYLNLPAGEYIVSINQQAFDANFKPLEFSKAADLIHNKSLELMFEIIQKKRQINIRKSE